MEENALEASQEIATSLWHEAQVLLDQLLRPWNTYQILIAAALFLIAHLLARLIGPSLHGWIRARQGWPKWRLRLLVMLHRRLRLIMFVLMIWPTVWIMQAATWPSRSYLLAIFASLALAWLLIALATRLIVNGFLRSVVRYAAWTWVTLRILGLTDETRDILDQIAIDLGDMRLSVWLVVQAIALLAVLMFGARFLLRSTAAQIRRNEEISPSMQVLAEKILQVLLYGAAFVIGLRAVGVDLTGLAVLSDASGVGCDPAAGSLDQAGRRDFAGRNLWLDQQPWGALRVDHHARRARISHSQRGPDYRAGGELVAFQRLRAARHRIRHRLFGRPPQGAPDRHRGRQERRPGVGIQAAGLPYRGLWRQQRGLPVALLDQGPDRGADQHSRQCLSCAVGCVPGARHLDPLPAARGADAGRSVTSAQTAPRIRPRQIGNAHWHVMAAMHFDSLKRHASLATLVSGPAPGR